MRIAAGGGGPGPESLEPFAQDLRRLEAPDVFFVAGDTTDHNDLDAFGEVIAALRDRVSCPVYVVFGNNEYAQDHGKYRERFGPKYGLTFLDDEAATVRAGGRGGRRRGGARGRARPP